MIGFWLSYPRMFGCEWLSIILIQAMIQKARIYPEFEYLPEKYQLDHFHNPYLAKLNIKITPRLSTSATPTHFVNPISGLNNIYLSHSLPLYKTQKFRFALIWRQYMTTKFARSHIGMSLQHKILDNYCIKAQLLTGTTSIVNAELSKRLKNSYEIFFGYSGFFETNHFYSSFSCGIRKGLYSLLLTHKLRDQTQFKVGGSRQLQDGISAGVFFNGNVLEPDRAEVDLSLNQQIDNKTTTSVSLGFNPFYREVAFKVNIERLITKSQKLLLCGQYNQKGSILYLGFKNLNFNLVFPFFATDSPIPLIIGAIGFGLAYLYRKQKPKQTHAIDISSDIQKTEVQRHEQLKLISDKANENYQRQKLHPSGLLIHQAYIGPDDEIAAFMNNPNRFRLLLRDEEYKSKFVDVTVTLRFYVSKNELKLRKGDKSKLLGFYRKQSSQNLIGVRYEREGNIQTKFFHINDPIVIKRQE